MQQQVRLGNAGFLSTVAAFGVGYFLGRTRKGRLALGLGVAMAARGLGGSDGLLAGGMSRVLGNGVLGKALEEAASSVRLAAGEVLNARIESMADAVHERTEALQARSGQPQEGRVQGEEAHGEEPQGEESEGGQARDGQAEQAEDADARSGDERAEPEVRRRPPSRQVQAGQRGGR